MFAFYIVDEEWDVTGTNSRPAAEAAAEDPSIIAVIDIQQNRDLCIGPIEIPENDTYKP